MLCSSLVSLKAHKTLCTLLTCHVIRKTPDMPDHSSKCRFIGFVYLLGVGCLRNMRVNPDTGKTELPGIIGWANYWVWFYNLNGSFVISQTVLMLFGIKCGILLLRNTAHFGLKMFKYLLYDKILVKAVFQKIFQTVVQWIVQEASKS